MPTRGEHRQLCAHRICDPLIDQPDPACTDLTAHDLEKGSLLYLRDIAWHGNIECYIPMQYPGEAFQQMRKHNLRLRQIGDHAICHWPNDLYILRVLFVYLIGSAADRQNITVIAKRHHIFIV